MPAPAPYHRGCPGTAVRPHRGASDGFGQQALVNLSVTLDTIPPVTPVFDLSSGSVTPATAGAHQTAAGRVTLVGQTDPNVSVTLLETGTTTVSSNTGTFQFPDVMLAPGGNPFTVQARDLAGNVTTQTLHLSLAAPVALTVTSVTPADGASEVGVTFRPKVTFSRPIDTTTLTTADFYATDPNGSVLPATVVPSTEPAWKQLHRSASLYTFVTLDS
jgi:hypothetical protein